MLQQQTQSPGWRVLNRDVIKYIATVSYTHLVLPHGAWGPPGGDTRSGGSFCFVFLASLNLVPTV